MYIYMYVFVCVNIQHRALRVQALTTEPLNLFEIHLVSNVFVTPLFIITLLHYYILLHHYSPLFTKVVY